MVAGFNKEYCTHIPCSKRRHAVFMSSLEFKSLTFTFKVSSNYQAVSVHTCFFLNWTGGGGGGGGIVDDPKHQNVW